jgi:hypothetical protein
MPHPLAETFRQAAELIANDPTRQGNCLHFAAGEEIVYAGDIHGHRRNLAKIIGFADLGAHPRRRLLLQEIVHGPTDQGGDRSVDVLLEAARLKLSYPEQVFFLIGNHDTAEIAGNEITRDGAGSCKAFTAGLQTMFGSDAAEVRSAVHEMLRSQPLAARCENRMLLSHSLPSPERMDMIDWGILRRPYRDEDFRRGGSVYEWTWGRGYTPEQLAELADRLEADQFLLGHKHIQTGHEVPCPNVVILASNHSHGAVIVIDAGRKISDEDLPKRVRPIVAL